MGNIIYLDTHVVLWLYDQKIEALSHRAKQAVQESYLLVSPFVLLELQYLFEIKKIEVNPEKILQILEEGLGLKIETCDLKKIILESLRLSWMRDPFDRLITAQAILHQRKLLTKDSKIRKNCKLAFWD